MTRDAAPASCDTAIGGYGSGLALRWAGTSTVLRCGVSIRRQRILVVDERVERRLDVELGVDHAGLLQRQARGEDRLALRRADTAVGQLGTLLELLVDHRLGEFCHRDK